MIARRVDDLLFKALKFAQCSIGPQAVTLDASRTKQLRDFELKTQHTEHAGSILAAQKVSHLLRVNPGFAAARHRSGHSS